MRSLMITVLLVLSCTSLALAQDDYHKVEVFAGYSYNSVDKIAGSELRSPELPDANNRSLARRKGLQGFDTSVTYNFSRYVGAKFEFSGHYGTEGNEANAATGERTGTFIPLINFRQSGVGLLTATAKVLTTRHTSHSFLGGVQIKDNSKDKRIKPFAHFLLGIARQSVKYIKPDSQIDANIDVNARNLGTDKVTNNGFSWALGGGLDIRVHRRMSVRVIQFDYNPVRTKDQTILAIGDIRDFSDFPSFTFDSRFNRAEALNSIVIPGRTQHNFRIGFGIVFH